MDLKRVTYLGIKKERKILPKKGYRQTEEHIKKKSQITRQKWQDPEYRKLQSKSRSKSTSCFSLGNNNYLGDRI